MTTPQPQISRIELPGVKAKPESEAPAPPNATEAKMTADSLDPLAVRVTTRMGTLFTPAISPCRSTVS